MGGKPIGTWMARANTKGRRGGVQECQPPKPCEGPCSTSWGAEGQGPGCSPWWGGLEERVLPHLGQRRFSPSWIPFCLLSPSAITRELRHLLLHIPGGYAEPCTGTRHSCQTEPDSGLGLPPKAASHSAPGPGPCWSSLLLSVPSTWACLRSQCPA